MVERKRSTSLRSLRAQLGATALATLTLLSGVAAAQEPAPSSVSAQPSPAPAATEKALGGDAVGSPETAPAAAASPTDAQGNGAAKEAVKPARPMAGYSYSTRAVRSEAAPRSRPRKSGSVTSNAAIVTMPGFEMRPDGGSRFMVALTRPVEVEQRQAAGSLTYVIHGAHIAKANNRHALVTVHFNTPAASARLVPHGGDLHFVLDMRAAAAADHRVETRPEGAALVIDFPKGNFVAAEAPRPEPET